MKTNIIFRFTMALSLLLSALPLHADGLKEISKLGDLKGVSYYYIKGPDLDNFVESNLISESMVDMLDNYLAEIKSTTILIGYENLTSSKDPDRKTKERVIRMMKDAVSNYISNNPGAEMVLRKKDSSKDITHWFIPGKDGKNCVYISCNEWQDLDRYAVGIFTGECGEDPYEMDAERFNQELNKKVQKKLRKNMAKKIREWETTEE